MLRLKIFISNWILPIGFSKVISKLLEKIRSFLSQAENLKFDNFEINFYDYIKYGTEKHFSYISIDKLRYQGGIAFNQIQHHFVKYYFEGESSLEKFYLIHKPKNILEKHFLFENYVSEISTKPHYFFGVPWKINDLDEDSKNKNFFSQNEEGLLIAKHGIQAHGPISQEKFKSEKRRLDIILNSIRKKGYRPDLFEGHIRGYFLIDDFSFNNEEIFLVTGGQHRIATLSYLGIQLVPVQFEPNFPRCIKLSDIDDWPLVKSNSMDKEIAKIIFKSYFRNVNLKLLKNW